MEIDFTEKLKEVKSELMRKLEYEQQRNMTEVLALMHSQNHILHMHREEAFYELQQEYHACQATSPHWRAEALGVGHGFYAPANSQIRLQALERLHKGSSKKARASRGIMDLSVDVLEHIFS